MNKTKKELYEENKKLKSTVNTYSEFWETDAIDESVKTMKNVKTILIIATFIILLITSFLIGLTIE